MARNAKVKAELATLLQKMEIGRVYTNPEVYNLSQQSGINAGYSTVSRWLDDLTMSKDMVRLGRGKWQRQLVVVNALGKSTQGVLPFEPSADPAIRGIQVAVSRIEAALASLLDSMRATA